MESSKYRIALYAAVLALLALAGCTTTVKKHEDASVIKQRAVQRWDYLIAHQAEKAYDFLTPGYRQTESRELYEKRMNGRGLRWGKVHFASQKCDKDVCHVHLIVDYSLRMGGPAGTVKSSGFLTETWIRADGNWYYLPAALSPAGPGKGKKH